jgi:hypothetical protein
MKKIYLAIAGLFLSALSCPAAAGVFADDLARCTVSESSAADRTVLVRWTFVVAAANPVFSDLASVSEAEREQAFRTAGVVFDRLLLHDCRRQSVAAIQNEGPAALESGFQALGLLAGREMMSSPASARSLQDLGRFMDMEGIASLRREAGIPEPPRPAPRH